MINFCLPYLMGVIVDGLTSKVPHAEVQRLVTVFVYDIFRKVHVLFVDLSDTVMFKPIFKLSQKLSICIIFIQLLNLWLNLSL